jgi:hypothetical protein
MILAGALTGAALLGSGCADHRVVYVQDLPKGAPATAGEVVVITDPPPPPQVEVVGAAPGPQYVWLPGCWEWHGSWVWRSGHWAVAPHPEAAWVPGYWYRHGRGWVWIHGYWR